MVRKPVITQAPINNAGESTSRAISAETRKMPDPIIEPITSMVELVRPRPLTNSRSVEEVVEVVTAGLVSTVRCFSQDEWLVISWLVVSKQNRPTDH